MVNRTSYALFDYFKNTKKSCFQIIISCEQYTLSDDPVITTYLSISISTQNTGPVCPRNVCNSTHLLMSQIFAYMQPKRVTKPK